jgi:hypothetical protein
LFKILRFTLAVFYISILHADDYYKGDTLVREGVHAFYNYEFDKAVNILSEARIQFPDHPGVHLIWAASRWVRSQAHSPVEETYRILQKDLDDIGPVYDELVDKYEYDPNYKLYQGSALGLSARVALGKKQWLRTLIRSYRGFIIIKDVAKGSPEITDAQLPIGIVEYFAGLSNPIISWAVRLYDLDASTESGLHRMALAADEGHWSWIEAKAILSNLYLWVENDPILALEHAKDLVRYFPDNYYFNLLYLESLIRTDKIDISKVIIRDMKISSSKLTDRQIKWYSPYLDYEIALLSFHQEDYPKALELVSQTIDDYTAELDIILGNAYLLQGMCYDRLDRRVKAKDSYNKCIALDNFSGSIKRAKEYLRQPFSGI